MKKKPVKKKPKSSDEEKILAAVTYLEFTLEGLVMAISDIRSVLNPRKQQKVC